MLRLDQSLEFAIQELVDDLDLGSPQAALLCDYAGCGFDQLAGNLLELLGLPPDDVARVANATAARIGAARMISAVECLTRLLRAKHFDLGPAHVKLLSAGLLPVDN